MRRTGPPRVSAFDVVVALLGVLLLYLAVPNLTYAIRSARPGDGVSGTFIAQQLNCVQHAGHKACDWRGTFRSDDGTRTRPSVTLYGGAGDLTAAARTKARDIGRASTVYRPAGTHEWILTALLALAGLALLLRAGLYRGGRAAVRALFPATARRVSTPAPPSEERSI